MKINLSSNQISKTLTINAIELATNKLATNKYLANIFILFIMIYIAKSICLPLFCSKS